MGEGKLRGNLFLSPRAQAAATGSTHCTGGGPQCVLNAYLVSSRRAGAGLSRQGKPNKHANQQSRPESSRLFEPSWLCSETIVTYDCISDSKKRVKYLTVASWQPHGVLQGSVVVGVRLAAILTWLAKQQGGTIHRTIMTHSSRWRVLQLVPKGRKVVSPRAKRLYSARVVGHPQCNSGRITKIASQAMPNHSKSRRVP